MFIDWINVVKIGLPIILFGFLIGYAIEINPITVVAVLTYILGWAMAVRAGFADSGAWGVICLLCPYGILIFSAFHWEETKPAFIVSTLSCLLFLLAFAAEGLII